MFPLHGVLVVITVVVFINVSSVRTEAKARKYQARCSGLVSYLMGGGGFGSLSNKIYFHTNTTSVLRKLQEASVTHVIQII